jgi:hypothetical protein
MMNWLTEDFHLGFIEASHVLGQCAHYDVANVFNPAYSVACGLARKAIPDLGRTDRP